jgi:hypothetical protein
MHAMKSYREVEVQLAALHGSLWLLPHKEKEPLVSIAWKDGCVPEPVFMLWRTDKFLQNF